MDGSIFSIVDGILALPVFQKSNSRSSWTTTERSVKIIRDESLNLPSPFGKRGGHWFAYPNKKLTVIFKMTVSWIPEPERLPWSLVLCRWISVSYTVWNTPPWTVPPARKTRRRRQWRAFLAIATWDSPYVLMYGNDNRSLETWRRDGEKVQA